MDIHKSSVQNDSMTGKRRKRINRMKTIIIIIIMLLMLIPAISCIYLGYKVNMLQDKVNELLIMHGRAELRYDIGLTEKYVYAAEKEKNNKEDNILLPDDSNQQIQDKDGNVNPLPEGQKGKADIVHDLIVWMKGKHNIVLDQTEELQAEDDNDQELEDQPQGNGDNIEDKVKAEQASGRYAGKKVYLTFDDGPSIYTDQILDTLAEHNVKATFFVTGKTDDNSLRLYQRIVDEGHTLGMHSYSHVYKTIYDSLEDFDKDFTKLWKLLYDTTGYSPTIFRFPGGSSNKVNKKGMSDFIQYLNEHSITYYDWNVDSGDAKGVKYTKEDIISNVLKGVSLKKRSIVLMHDLETKQATADSLSELLSELIQEGAEILSLNDEVKPIQQITFDSIK